MIVPCGHRVLGKDVDITSYKCSICGKSLYLGRNWRSLDCSRIIKCNECHNSFDWDGLDQRILDYKAKVLIDLEESKRRKAVEGFSFFPNGDMGKNYIADRIEISLLEYNLLKRIKDGADIFDIENSNHYRDAINNLLAKKIISVKTYSNFDWKIKILANITIFINSDDRISLIYVLPGESTFFNDVIITKVRIDGLNESYSSWYKCTKCSFAYLVKNFNYCPTCGKKLK